MTQLSDAIKKSDQLIDVLYDPAVQTNKPSSYREVARNKYQHAKKIKSFKDYETRANPRLQASFW